MTLLLLLACAPDPCTGFIDADGDGFGDEDARFDCDAPAVLLGGDCDDADPHIFPGAVELCNDGRDDACDGHGDEGAVDAVSSWVDGDGDGFGAGQPTVACEVPEGAATVDGDCDDTDAERSPAAPEVCDGVDQDCDGLVDEDSVNLAVWYADEDGDGYGDPGASVETCPGPEGWVLNGADCDDADPARSPDADEVCDGVDNDCSGVVDEWAVDASDWYPDHDGDGYGSGASTGWASCDAPYDGYADNDADCDDYDADVHPGATDVPGDREDTDCDGTITCYADHDGDGYGGTSAVWSADSYCQDGTEEAATSTDCDDADASTHPSAPEVPYDGVDQDCDGVDLRDADGDGWEGEAVGGTDCDDTDRTVNPGATERCDADGIDDDCDGLVNDADPDLATTSTWYGDADLDGWGDDAAATVAVCAPAGAVAAAGDCDDADPDVHPFATEDCAAGVDANCDGSTGTVDADGDGAVACEDCDDASADTRPGAAEVDGNGADDDCDGLVDEYVGDVRIAAEADARALCAGWASVEGDLDLQGLDSLRDLDCLRAVSGDLRISDVGASDLDGLEGLGSVGGDLLVGGWEDDAGLMAPSAFTSLDGLDRLRTVGGDLWVAENDVGDLDGIPRLESVGESLVLWDLPIARVALPVTTLGDDLWLESLPELVDVSAPALTAHGGSLWLESLAADTGAFSLTWPVPIGGRLALVDLPDGATTGWVLPDTVGALTVSGTELSALDGLEDLRVVQGEVYIADNPALVDTWGLDGLKEVDGDMTISQVGTDWDAFSNLRTVGGWLRVAGSHTAVSGFGALEQVGEGLALDGANLETVTGFGALVECPSLELTTMYSATDLSGLRAVPFSRDVTVTDLRALGDLSFLGGVRALSGELSVTACSGLASLDGLDGLTSVGGAVTVGSDAALASAELSSLSDVGGALTLDDLPLLGTLDLPALRVVGGDVALSDLDVLADLRGLPDLEQVGGLSLEGLPSLVDLDGLDRLQTVDGSLILEDLDGLGTLSGLGALETVGVDLHVERNASLVDLDGLTALQTVGQDLTLESNTALVRPVALGALQSVGRDVWVESNPALVDLQGLGTFTVGGKLWLYGDDALASVDGLEGLEDVPDDLVLADLPSLTSLAGLSNLQRVGDVLRVGSCPLLVDLSGLDALSTVGGSVEIGEQPSWPGWGGSDAGLVTLDGLGSLQSVGSDLWIQDDPLLDDISALAALQTVGGDLGVLDNPSLWTADADALAARVSVGGSVVISGNR